MFIPAHQHMCTNEHTHTHTNTCIRSPSCPQDYYQDPQFSNAGVEMQREAGRAAGLLSREKGLPSPKSQPPLLSH